MFRTILSAVALFILVACDAPDATPAPEPPTDAALRDRLTDHRITMRNAANDRSIRMDLRAGGTGRTQFIDSGRVVKDTPLRWAIRKGQVCAADAGDPLDCAVPTITGDRITLAWRT